MKTVLQFLGVSVSIFVALVGLVLIARALQVTNGPLLPPVAGWTVYRLDLASAFDFYEGCAITGLSLGFLWIQRPK
jgi:hypothetical protein